MTENTTSQPGAEQEFDNKNQSGTDLNVEIKSLKEQISELRKEAAKYRTSARTAASEKQSAQEQLKNLYDELEKTKKENTLVKRQSLLDKAGCIKSELVVNVIPDDCEDVQGWIENYRKENTELFKLSNHGGFFKPANANNMTPSQLMNSYIRGYLGR